MGRIVGLGALGQGFWGIRLNHGARSEWLETDWGSDIVPPYGQCPGVEHSLQADL